MPTSINNIPTIVLTIKEKAAEAFERKIADDHLYALIDCGLYKSEDSVNMLALLAGFVLSSIASFLMVRIIYLSGIRDAIAEYRLIK